MNADDIPPSFRGLLWVPGSEQEVVFLFGVLLHQLPWPIAIDEIRCAFPDCLAHRTDTGTPVRIEFELYGSNFRDHGHDPAGCDVVVCWEDDLRDWPPDIAVIELSRIVKVSRKELVLRSRPKRLQQPWDEERFHSCADERVSALVRELTAKLVNEPNLHIPYDGNGKDATCKVVLRGHNPGIFWIWADGRYQWCWQSFRGRQPEVISRFQQLVGNNNESSFGEQRARAVLKYTADQLADILTEIANAACPGGHVSWRV